MKKELQVAGMSCQHCVRAVTKALSALEGVDSVEVTLETGKVVVTGSENMASDEAINAAITEEGFELKSCLRPSPIAIAYRLGLAAPRATLHNA